MTVHPHQPHWLRAKRARTGPSAPATVVVHADQTLPVAPPPAVAFEPTILGFPAEPAPGPEESGPVGWSALDSVVPPPAEQPAPAPSLVAERRSEWSGGVALLLAGVLAGVSLGLPWWRHSGASGLRLLEQGLGILGTGLGPLGRSGLWQPVVIVLGGGVLLVLGLLLFRPARTHRVVGLLALLVTMAVAVGVVVPIADANWSTASFGPGMWLAVAVAVLGLVGAVKAMETAPHLRASAG
jgi:hypothetical protein